MRLSISMPTNRTSLDACARILNACSLASEDVEVVIRDNSGDDGKRRMLSLIDRPNCHVHLVDPCSIMENGLAAISGCTGDFIFCIADDDDIHAAPVADFVQIIRESGDNPDLVGISGHYMVEGPRRSRLLSYGAIDSDSAVERVGALFDIHTNLYHYSAFRRSVQQPAINFLLFERPFFFSFDDQFMSLIYLSSGRTRKIDRVIYRYDPANWKSSDAVVQANLKFYLAGGLDPAFLRLHWLLCAFEGAKIVLGKYPGLRLSPDERQRVADRWFQYKFNAFVESHQSYQGAPGAQFDAEGALLADKWKNVRDVDMSRLLDDLADFMALSTIGGAQKYHSFWE